MPLDPLTALASVGLFGLTAFLSGAFWVWCVLRPGDRYLPSSLVALCLGTGLTFNALVSLLAGLFVVTAAVPVAVSVLLGLAAVLLRRHALDLAHAKAFVARAKSDLPGLLVLVCSFAYFVVVAGLLQWPPPGDISTAHGPMVTLFLADGRIPLTEQGYVILYPPGLQALAASMGPVVLAYGADMIFALGATLAALLAPLIYAITLECTRSCRWAVVVALVPFIPHQFVNLEQWTVGYFFNGPYPNLFGFVILLTLVAVLLFDQRTEDPARHLKRTVLAAVMTLAFLFIYPSFSILAALLTGLWMLLHWGPLRAELAVLLRPSRARLVLIGGIAAVASFVVAYVAALYAVGQNPAVMTDYLLGRFVVGAGGAAAAPSPYAETPTFFIDHPSGWVSIVAMVVVGLRIWRRSWDFLDVFYIALGLTLFVSLTGPGFAVTWFILPSRISPLFALLGWPLLIREALARAIPAPGAPELSVTGPARAERVLVRSPVLPVLVAAIVILTPVAVQPGLVGALVDPVTFYGIFFPRASFQDNFQVLRWIAQNADHTKLMANDGSYLSRYLMAVTVQNMSNTNWAEARYPQRGYDLMRLWLQPRNVSYLSQVIRAYGVRYIFTTSDPDSVYPPVSFEYEAKRYPPALFDTIFDRYSFLVTDYAASGNRVYEVRSVPTITTAATLANVTAPSFWNTLSAEGSGSLGPPIINPNGTLEVQSGTNAAWVASRYFPSVQDWTTSTYLSAEIETPRSLGLNISLVDAGGRSITWSVITLAGQPTRVDLPLAFPDGGSSAFDLAAITSLAITTSRFGAPTVPGDEFTVSGLFLSQ